VTFGQNLVRVRGDADVLRHHTIPSSRIRTDTQLRKAHDIVGS